MNITVLSETTSQPGLHVDIPEGTRVSCAAIAEGLLAIRNAAAKDPKEAPDILDGLIIISQLHSNHASATDPYFLPNNFDLKPYLALVLDQFDRLGPADLRARVGDLAWLLNRDAVQGNKSAQSYIEAATALFHAEKWTECFERIRRSLTLAALLNNPETHKAGISYVRETLMRLEGKDPLWLTVKLAEVYAHAAELVEPEILFLLHKAARTSALVQHDHRKESSLWNCYAACADRNALPKQKRRAQLLAVRAKLREAHARKKADGNALVAASLLQDAVSDLAKIPKSASLRQRLLPQLRLAQEEATSAFGVFKTEINLKPVLEAVQDLLKAADPRQAIFNFVSLYRPDNPAHATEYVLRKQKEFLFMHLFGSTQYDTRSKVASRRPPLPLDRPPTNEELWPELMEHYTFAQNYHGSTSVRLALREMALYHNLSYGLLEGLVNESPIVASNQRKTCTAALYAGFHHDMPTFAYMGIPLFEGCLRHLLLTSGGNILRQDPKTGEQTEITLFGLLTSPELLSILGENVVTDLRALLDDQFGFKLRHNLAHGLLSDNVANSAIIYYAFLVFTFLLFMPLIIGNSRSDVA